jgi:hypothetical protein
MERYACTCEPEQATVSDASALTQPRELFVTCSTAASCSATRLEDGVQRASLERRVFLRRRRAVRVSKGRAAAIRRTLHRHSETGGAGARAFVFDAPGANLLAVRFTNASS